jgi:predicted RNA-binding protein with PUA-like domain
MAVVDIAPVRRLPRRVPLALIKGDRAFATFPLVRISRLSVMPVTPAEWARIEKLAAETD